MASMAQDTSPASADRRTGTSRGGALAYGVVVLAAAAVIGSAGGAGAAGLLTGRNVADNSLRSVDFHDGTVTAARFRDGSLTQADLGFDIRGDQGAPGRQGPQGPAGISAVTVRHGPLMPSGDLPTVINAFVQCESGEIALAGGVQLNAMDLNGRPVIENSHRVDETGWLTFIGTSGHHEEYTPWVVCARVS